MSQPKKKPLLQTAGRVPLFLLTVLLFPRSLCPQVPKENASADPVITSRTSQSPSPSHPKPNGTVDAPTGEGQADEQNKTQDSEGKQTKRLFWIAPNFAAVSANTELPPLSKRGKFVLATYDSIDYSSFTWTAIIAGQSLALNSDPELGHGISGYGRYYWRAYADGVSGTFFTEAIVPVLTHQDPRYYTLGHGGFLRRTVYALSRVVLTKTDSGGTSFNFSEVMGNGLEAGLSNAYYPPQERGAAQTARDWATQIESAGLNNIAKEFWPDIRRKILRQK